MPKLRPFLPAAVLALLLTSSTRAHAGVIFESATTALTGAITTSGGIRADSEFYSGVNFQLTTDTLITGIGGNFGFSTANGNNMIFGAIAAVSGPNGTPNLANVLGTTLLTLTPSRVEVYSNTLNLTLSAGWYAVFFGSGRFGATANFGFAAKTLNGQNANTNGIPTYSIRASDGQRFAETPGARYFVQGHVVPEPSSFVLTATALPVAVLLWKRRRAPLVEKSA